MKKGTTLFLKIVILLIGSPILALCLFGFFWFLTHPANPNYAHLLYPIIVGIYLSTLPFFYALFQAFRLLTYIDHTMAFSNLSVKALTRIKYSAFTISLIYILTLPILFLLAQVDDAPGLILMGAILIFASFVIAFFAAVLQNLLQEAIEIKNENDLTV